MRILLIGKHKIISHFIKSHILIQSPSAEITELTPWGLSQMKGTYQLILFNNLYQNDSIDQAVKTLLPFVEKPENIILLGKPDYIKKGDRSTYLNPAENTEEFNKILRKAADTVSGDNFKNERDFIVKYTLACQNRESLRSLTNKQIRVIQYVLSGKTYKEVADALNVSVDAIKKQMSAVYKKTNIKGKGELNRLFRNERTTRS
ncbi:MAG: helix-turn-helix transcriptional regulator [Spirochaetales bacterium]|nr:helix-turn-helix transcriptional regulator [Spirochaetales bacterium]